MKYKIGDKLKLKIYKNKLYLKKDKLAKNEYIEDDFLIVAINDKLQYYTVIIHDNMIGWTINDFHIIYLGVKEKFMGKKFFDVFESQI
jgi:hypothetical protein